MENIIQDMIDAAWRHSDREMATQAFKLMFEFARTDDCPAEWRGIGPKMAQKYKSNDWVYAYCALSEFV